MLLPTRQSVQVIVKLQSSDAGRPSVLSGKDDAMRRVTVDEVNRVDTLRPITVLESLVAAKNVELQVE